MIPGDPDEPDEQNPDDADDAVPTAQPTVDAANPKGVKKARREQSIRQDEAKAFWTAVFASPIGRREMWGVLQAAHTFNPVFAMGPTGFPDQAATWFQAGEQGLGQRLWKSWLAMDRDGVILMMNEYDPQLPKKQPPK